MLMVILFQIFVRKQIFCFASICTPIKNASALVPFSYKTNTNIDSFKVTESDILSIVKSLDSIKAHVCDNLSIRMIKMCSESITLPLKIIFQESIKKGKFPEIWKRRQNFYNKLSSD